MKEYARQAHEAAHSGMNMNEEFETLWRGAFRSR
jgi:hypothetical protein